MSAGALQIALALFEKPALASSLRRAAIPHDVLDLIRFAAGDEQAALAFAQIPGVPQEHIREAATFYLQQVLLYPDADPYRVLGCEPGAPLRTRREHMRWLMLWLHPDHNKNSWENQLSERVLSAWNEIRNDRDTGRSFPAIGENSDEEVALDLSAGSGNPSTGGPRIEAVHAKRNNLWRGITIGGVLVFALALFNLVNSQTETTLQIAELNAEAEASQPGGPSAGEPSGGDETSSIAAAAGTTDPPRAFAEADAPRPTSTPDRLVAETVGPADPVAETIEEASEAPRTGFGSDVETRAAGEAIQEREAIVERVAQDAQAPNEIRSGQVQPSAEPGIEREIDEAEAPASASTDLADAPAGDPSAILAAGSVDHQVEIGTQGEVQAVHELGPSPASFASGEESVSVLPADAEPPILSRARAEDLLARFLRTYESGDLEALLRLFAADATNNRGGVEAIRDDYADLFEDTDARHLAITNMNWVRDGEYMIGGGRFVATVVRSRRGREREVTGEITVIVSREGNEILIREIRHRNDIL